jgi:hypothetical protein
MICDTTWNGREIDRDENAPVARCGEDPSHATRDHALCTGESNDAFWKHSLQRREVG